MKRSMRGTRNSSMVVSGWPSLCLKISGTVVLVAPWISGRLSLTTRRVRKSGEVTKRQSDEWVTKWPRPSPRSLKPTVLPTGLPTGLPRAKMPPADSGSEAPMEFHQRERGTPSRLLPSFVSLKNAKVEKISALQKVSLHLRESATPKALPLLSLSSLSKW